MLNQALTLPSFSLVCSVYCTIRAFQIRENNVHEPFQIARIDRLAARGVCAGCSGLIFQLPLA
jgi:hypothetical protein